MAQASSASASGVYDGRSHRTAIDDPNAGHWEFAFTDGGDVERRIDPVGNVVRYVYDALGRVTEEWHKKVEQRQEHRVSAYHYDAPSDEHAELADNLAGSLAWAEDPAGKLFVGYDARGHQVTAVRHWVDGTEHVTRSAFDAADRQVERGYPDDTYLRFEYNARSLLRSIGPVASNIQWRASGQLDSVTLGNGIVDRREYDERQRLTRLAAVAPDGRVVRDVGYTLDSASRITGIDDLRPKVPKGQSASTSYVFDDRSRLHEATDALGKTTFDYDNVGKITHVQSERPDASLNVTNVYGGDGVGPDTLTQHGDEVLKYDAAGRVVEDGSRRLSWDAKGRLERVERAGIVEEYTYAFDDSRALKVTTQEGNKSEVRYVAPDVEDRDGKLVRYVSVNGERIARLDSLDSAASSSSTRVPPSTASEYGGLLRNLGMLLVGAAAALFAAVRTLRRFRPARVVFAFGALVLLAFAVGCGSSKAPHATRGMPVQELPTSTIFYLADIQGSPLAVADRAAASISSSTYFPYGLVKNEQGTRVDPHRFVGNEHDEGADLADFHARPYRPDLGTFLAPDPLALFSPEKLLEDPRRLFAYAYAGADPINGSDPTGLTFGEYLSGIWDQTKENAAATVRAVADTGIAQVQALAERRFGDYALMQLSAAKAMVTAPIELVKNVANFGDNFAEAVFAANDYEAGRKAVKPITTAMTTTASVLGAYQTGKAALSRIGTRRSVGAMANRDTPKIPRRALDTVDHVRQTGNAPPGKVGGGPFRNDGRGGGRILPRQAADGSPITYKEYDTKPFTGANRGMERAVVGSDGRAWYTDNHYQSFLQMPKK